MSGYRSYVPWTKPSSSTSSSSNAPSSYVSSKKESSSTSSKYDSPYGNASGGGSRSRPEAKKGEDKELRAAAASLSKYSPSGYTAGSYSRENSVNRDPSRIKSPIDTKLGSSTTSHPPVTYRPLLRTPGARSRDPSPAEREKTESSSSFGNSTSNSSSYRLYNRPYTRSVSREDLPSTTIPKYSGRSSLNKDNYLGRTSRNGSREDLSVKTKEDLLKERFGRKDDGFSKKTEELKKRTEELHRKTEERRKLEDRLGRKTDELLERKSKSDSLRKSTDELLSRTNDALGRKTEEFLNRAAYKSKEDLYITSRFLPKNSIEKSHTAYIRPASTRLNEVSRKNRELLNVLTTTHDAPSRSVSRSSSISHDDYSKSLSACKDAAETETILMITRSTSPNPQATQPSITRRVDPAKLVERKVTRMKNRGKLLDKEIQSDRLDDSTKSSKFAGANRIAPAPWSSYLDLKYSSPSGKEGASQGAKPETDSSQSSSDSSSEDSEDDEEIKAKTSNVKTKASNVETKALETKPLNVRMKFSNDPSGVKAKFSNGEAKPSSVSCVKTKLLSNVEAKALKIEAKPLKIEEKPLKIEAKPLKIETKSSDEERRIKRDDKSSGETPLLTTEDDPAGEKEAEVKKPKKIVKKIIIKKKILSRNNSSSSTDLNSELPTESSKNSEGSDARNEKELIKKKPGTKIASLSGSNLDLRQDVGKKTPKDFARRESSEENSVKKKISALSRDKSDLKEDALRKDSLSSGLRRNSSNADLKDEGLKKDLRRNGSSSSSALKRNDSNSTINSGSNDESKPIVKKKATKISALSRDKSDLMDDSLSTGLRRSSNDEGSPVIKKKVTKISSLAKDKSLDSTDDGSVRRDSNSKETLDDAPKKLTKLKKQLPPQIPRPLETPVIKEPALHSLNPLNKDFRKSVLNMNPETVKTKKLTTPHSSCSDSSSSSDEDEINKTSIDDSLPIDKPSKEIEAKSFLMRALAPVTNFFRGNTLEHNSPEHEWWLDSSEATDKGIPDLPESDSGKHKKPKKWWLEQQKSSSDDQKSSLRLISRANSQEKSWWLDDGDVSKSHKSVRVLRHVDSGERAWWLDPEAEVPPGVEVYKATSIDETGKKETGRLACKTKEKTPDGNKWWWETSSSQSLELKNYKIRHIDSGEQPWWATSQENIDEPYPLGDRASPEGLETPLNETVEAYPVKNKKKKTLFISRHTNIDDILGASQLLSPLMDRIFSYGGAGGVGVGGSESEYEEVDAAQVKVHEGTAKIPKRLDTIGGSLKKKTPQKGKKLDDAALQLYKDGDYGSYLDLDASISEQQEEFDGFHSNKKNSIVLRTQLSVRVHTIIEKLLTSEGRELRRALFSLKQIFQEDKDLVHEFVQNDGLACLIKVGSEADQNYQNYILRALGQVMLYVDGMNGVMEHNQTVQWLYTLISSKFRLVVKTALKLLLVFVEYTDSNCMLLIKAIHAVDCMQGLLPWFNIMKLLKDFDSADTELLIYATTLINKTLNGIPDQDTYYDQTDSLEEQGIENIIKRYMSKPSTDLDLLQQFQIYEAVLQYEDGEDKGTPIRHLDESIRKTLRSRKSLVDSTERRKSRRHSTGTSPVRSSLNVGGNQRKTLNSLNNNNDNEDDESSSSQSTNGLNGLNGGYKDSNKACDVGVTPALRRRRERAERQRSFMKEQQENATILRGSVNNGDDNNENGNYTNGLQQRLGNNILKSRKDLTERLNAANKLDSEENGSSNNNNNNKQSWIMYNDEKEEPEKLLHGIKKENTVKDLTQKLASQNILHSPSEENKLNRIEGMTGLINKAKEGLAKSKSQANVLKSPAETALPAKAEVKKSENELRWEELVTNMNRPLNLCDMDFTDLVDDDENDVLTPVSVANGIPPPPPPLDLGAAPPPPPRFSIPPPTPPPVFQGSKAKPAETKIPTIKKNKKTVKLFWKEVRDDPVASVKLKTGYIWDELNPVVVDTQKLEHLFESKAKDLINKKQQEMNKNKEIIVLDPKRSNAINIGMTKLPPPRSIKTAILKMDATIMNREGIEKLLTMLPTEEERTKIQEAQAANPDLPLGSAEQFLLTLASISELPARLRLWAFKLDFENTEKEIAEPLMDLKQGFEVLKVNKTFRGILSTLLSIGNFLNGNEVKGFQIEYLSKVPEVKDTVNKHSLLHHLCHIVMEKFPDASDLYSEIGAITRASKVDFDELSLNIQRLESDCKASWDHLKLIAKHDGSAMKAKMSDFLADCAERIILLGIIHRRVMNRFHKFLLWLGIPLHQISDTKPNEFCRIVSEFALEYRTTRERVLQQLEKKANHRERNKTRGKMITETAKFRTKEDRQDAELRQLLGSDISDVESLQGTLPFRRPQRKDANRALMNTLNGHLTDGDDEILESLVKTATKAPTSRTAPRERKRTRHADRKSLRRTLKNGLSEEEKKHLSTYIKGY